MRARPRPAKQAKDETAVRVLPMQLQIGDRITDETGEYEIIGRPYMTNTLG